MNPGDRIGPYRLVRLLGRGGMGEVFAAVHERIGQQVAIKCLSDVAPGGRPSGRMLAEARALAQLEHPGIVRILSCDELPDGTPYLVMEYLEGSSLRTWLREVREQSGAVSLAAAIDLGRQLAVAMTVVHRARIVHRDLKPENILLLPAPEGERPAGVITKILDFGIAKVPSRGELGSGSGLGLGSWQEGDTALETAPAGPPLGTVTYMAPEQVRCVAEVDVRADVYALGVILYELLAGAPPFIGEPVSVLAMHLSAPAPPLAERRVDAPAWLCDLIAAMLAKDPAERPTMEEVGVALAGAHSEGRPEQASEQPPECPFPGMRHFTAEQAHLFFGREAHIEEALALFGATRSQGYRRWLHIEGPSGAGKSSLVQAGLLERLRAAKDWHIAVMRPGSSPLLNLAQVLHHAWSTAARDDLGELEQTLRSSPDALRNLARSQAADDTRLLLVVDQLEEAFTLAGDGGGEFSELLGRALGDRDGPLHLITTLRSDLAHRMERLPGLQRLLGEASHYHLRPLGESELRQALQGMVEASGLRLS